jgi:hypothetical protein
VNIIADAGIELHQEAFVANAVVAQAIIIPEISTSHFVLVSSLEIFDNNVFLYISSKFFSYNFKICSVDFQVIFHNSEKSKTTSLSQIGK